MGVGNLTKSEALKTLNELFATETQAAFDSSAFKTRLEGNCYSQTSVPCTADDDCGVGGCVAEPGELLLSVNDSFRPKIERPNEVYAEILVDFRQNESPYVGSIASRVHGVVSVTLMCVASSLSANLDGGSNEADLFTITDHLERAFKSGRRGRIMFSSARAYPLTVVDSRAILRTDFPFTYDRFFT